MHGPESVEKWTFAITQICIAKFWCFPANFPSNFNGNRLNTGLLFCLYWLGPDITIKNVVSMHLFRNAQFFG